ncbi:MAG: SDR family oxidoreductase [Bacteroidetes bacterium]|nr:SDR family oxidoreductase [Bacteroidota bacterium]
MTEVPVALVTAASRGMGAAIARELANRGYRLVMMSRTDDVLKLADDLAETTPSPGTIGTTGSVTETEDLERLVTAALSHFGRIDAVVNNTGHAAKDDLLDIPDEDWHAGLDLLLLNVVRMARLVTPIMERQGGGGFVNVSTFAAFEPSLDFPVSSSLRAALGSFTKMYADRYGPAGIRMNNVLPGYIETYETTDALREAIPLKRQGSVEEIAKTVAFLLSEDAGYITGQNIRVDGGLARSV